VPTRRAEQTGVQVPGARVSRHEEVLIGHVSARPGHAKGEAVAQVRVEGPGEWRLSAPWVSPHTRKLLVEPRRRVIVPHVVREVVPGHNPAVSIEDAPCCEALPSGLGVLRVVVIEGVVLKEGGVSHCVEPQGVGVHVGVEAREDLGVLPLRRNAAVRATRAPGVDLEVSVLVGPWGEAGNVDHRLTVDCLPGGAQDSPQGAGVSPQGLVRIVHGSFILPDAQIEDEPALRDDVVLVGECVIDRRAGHA